MRPLPLKIKVRRMWTEQSRSRMQGVDPRLIAILEEARRASGINFEISEGMRDSARQAEMVRTGKSQTMNSRHLHGNAMDVHILNPDGSINWDFDAYRPVADAAKAAAARLGYDDFVWGGDWKSLRDGVHFQIGGAQGAPATRAAAKSSQPGQAAPTKAAVTPAIMAGLAEMLAGQQAQPQGLFAQGMAMAPPPPAIMPRQMTALAPAKRDNAALYAKFFNSLG